MKRLTKNNLLKLIELKKAYESGHDAAVLKMINSYISNVINRSNHYFTFLSSCNFTTEQLRYLLY